MALFGSKEPKVKKTADEVYREKLQEFLMDGEEIESVYPLIVDYLCFTNKRLIFVDNRIKDLEMIVTSIPYKMLVEVGLVKNQKFMAFTDELVICSRAETHKLKFVKGSNIVEIYNKVVGKIL